MKGMGVTKYSTEEERREAKRISSQKSREKARKVHAERVRSILQRKSIGIQATILSIGGTLIASNKGLLESTNISYHPTFADMDSEPDSEPATVDEPSNISVSNISDDWFEMSE